MKSLLIRAEDKNRWERRAPITPDDARQIIERTGAQVYVQQSAKRWFNEDAYQQAGARICADMTPGDVILGVKEIPLEKIVDQRTYLFFSHTIKGQKDNMPLLKRMIDGKCTLIDYEKIVDAQQRRLVYFGRYAGDAGAIDILSLMGEYWQHQGIDTPLKQVRRAHQYESVEAAKAHISQIGDEIRRQGMPAPLSPLVIGILGYGNVAGGAQQILDGLPTVYLEPDQLSGLGRTLTADPHQVYVVVFKEKDMVCATNGRDFDLQHYYAHPEAYEGNFDRFLPHLTLIVNAVYWESRYPRFVTWDALKTLFGDAPTPKLCGIADITCDVGGSIECNVKATDSDMPAYRVDPLTRQVQDGHVGSGVVVLAVDNLPCELPRDASTFFSSRLAPLLDGILAADLDAPFDQVKLADEIRKAVIVHNGQLTPDYQYLAAHLPA